jgi:hypothetical protein
MENFIRFDSDKVLVGGVSLQTPILFHGHHEGHFYICFVPSQKFNEVWQNIKTKCSKNTSKNRNSHTYIDIFHFCRKDSLPVRRRHTPV